MTVASSPGSPKQRESGRLALDRREGGVAEAPAAAGGDHKLGALAHQVGEHLAVLRHHDGAVGHGEPQVVGARAVAHVSRALPAVVCLAVGGVVVVEQGGHLGVDVDDDGAAAPAVAAVGAAEGLELLAVHGRDAAPALACGRR